MPIYKYLIFNSCYCNATGKMKPESFLVDYEIKCIHDLIQILGY